MSTLTVANVETANGSTDLTLMTGNSSGPKLVITAGGNILFNNINANTITIPSVVTNPYTTNTLTVTKQLNLTSNVTPANLGTNNTVDWNPGVAGDYQIRFQANSTNATILEYNVYGLTGGVAGQLITLTNIGPTRVVLRTEESGNSTFNQANSVNRFSLPNHIPLEGYQSIELYYDGTSQRWRGVDTQGFPFFYKQALTKGFWAGGITPTLTANTEKITYSSETISSATGANLSQARQDARGLGNADKGFFIGGATPTYVATVDRILFSTETSGLPTGTNLSQTRYHSATAGNADKGFIVGGYTPTMVATADRTTYSTETTAAVSGANISQARAHFPGVGNSDKGFFSGGFTVVLGTAVTTADRTRYSTETTAAVSGANLSQTRAEPVGIGTIDKGFFAGGYFPAYVATAERINYSSEVTAAVSGANLSQAKDSMGGAGNADKGFTAGGFTPAPATITTDRTTYSTETTASATGANLAAGRSELSAV